VVLVCVGTGPSESGMALDKADVEVKIPESTADSRLVTTEAAEVIGIGCATGDGSIDAGCYI